MKPPKLLLFSWGRGNGHITRLLTIAKAFRQAGWDCYFVGHRDQVHDDLISRDGFEEPYRYPDWAETADPWTNWSDPRFLQRSIDFDVQVITELHPDRVINDNRLSVLIGCITADIPVVTLCQDNQLPDYRYPGEDVAEIWTSPVNAINRELERRSLLLQVRDVRELFGTGTVAIPSTESLDPVAGDYDFEIVYTGPLGPTAGAVEGANDLLFYRTVGELDDSFLQVFGDWPGTIFIATGDAERARSLETSCPTVRVAPLWDLDQIGPSLRAVVHHGGHGITTSCVSSALPAVVLPGHNPERFSNGVRAERLGLAEVLPAPTPDGIVWGPAVDVSGDRPEWDVIRVALERAHREARKDSIAVSPVESGSLVETLT